MKIGLMAGVVAVWVLVMPSVFALSESDFGCVSITKMFDGNSSKWTGNYVNCSVMPQLNVTNVTNITQVTVLNITNTTLSFNETSIASNVLNWQDTFARNLELNKSVIGLSASVRQLSADNDAMQRELLQLRPLNTSYQLILSELNSTKFDRDSYRSSASNLWAYAGVGGVIGFAAGYSRKQVSPLKGVQERRLTGTESAESVVDITAAIKDGVQEDNVNDSKKEKK